LRENFPNAHLEILGYKHIVALAEQRFYADATRSIEYAAMSGFFVPRSELAPDLSEYFASFQQVISYLFDPDGFFEGNLRRAGVKHLLTAHTRIDDSEHAARQLARPLQGLALFLDDDHAPTVHPSDADRQFAREFLADVPPPRIAIHCGSGSPKKNWPLEHWIAIGDWILSRTPRSKLVLIGGEADRPQLEVLRKRWSEIDVIVARDLPLPQLAAILEKCALFLGHDSGISHLAAAVGTRCVLLFGGTDPAIWAPTNATVEVVQADGGDLSRLAPAILQSRIEPQLRHLAS
jgi:heptosyltransferase-2